MGRLVAGCAQPLDDDGERAQEAHLVGASEDQSRKTCSAESCAVRQRFIIHLRCRRAGAFSVLLRLSRLNFANQSFAWSDVARDLLVLVCLRCEPASEGRAEQQRLAGERAGGQKMVINRRLTRKRQKALD